MLRSPEDLTSSSREKHRSIKVRLKLNLLDDNIVITLSDLPRQEHSLSSLTGSPMSIHRR